MHQVVLAASIISKSGKGMGWMALVNSDSRHWPCFNLTLELTHTFLVSTFVVWKLSMWRFQSLTQPHWLLDSLCKTLRLFLVPALVCTKVSSSSFVSTFESWSMSQTDLRVYWSFGVGCQYRFVWIATRKGANILASLSQPAAKTFEEYRILSAIECRSEVLTWSKQHLAPV